MIFSVVVEEFGNLVKVAIGPCCGCPGPSPNSDPHRQLQILPMPGIVWFKMIKESKDLGKTPPVPHINLDLARM